MADRRLRDRGRWVQVGVCRVRLSLFPAPVVETDNRSGRAMTAEDRNVVTRYVKGELEEAGYTVDGVDLHVAIWRD